MHPSTQTSPVPASILPDFGLVFDAVYNPIETKLLREARLAGVKTVDGLEMFIGQAAQQFVLFTGKVAPTALMRSILLSHQ
jgi:shikimate 5-dehydrogenase